MTKSSGLNALARAAAAAMLALPALAAAQGGFAGIADPTAMDTLSGGSVGGPSFAVDRARGVAADPFGGGGGDPFATPAGDPFATPAGDPFGGGGGDPFGGGAGAFGADPFGGGAGFAGQPGGFQAPQIPKIQAIYGTRVICRVTGEMLDDAVTVPVFDTFRDSYYDDGKTAMDLKANDFTYTNVTLKDDAMSPEAHLVLSRIVQGLRSLEDLPPNEFYSVLVASSDPLAGVPQMLDLERERDDKLGRWAEKFLEEFRIDPSESTKVGWDFYETYMPPPPVPPFKDVPAGFFPPNAERSGGDEANQEGGAAGGGATGAVRSAFGADNIQGNAGASSSYFGGAGAATGK